MKYKEEESFLIDMICETNDEVRNSLYKTYEPNIKMIVKKYINTARKLGLDINDLLQEANVGFTDAINNYDPSRGSSLKTFVQLCIERKIINYIEKNKTQKNKIILDSLSLEYDYDEKGLPLKEILGDESQDPFLKYAEKDNLKDIGNKIKNKLSKMEYQVFKLMLDGKKTIEIANILDKNAKQIDNTQQRMRAKVREILKESKNEE